MLKIKKTKIKTDSSLFYNQFHKQTTFRTKMQKVVFSYFIFRK